jgi:nifR3 family TIM-barrel protein
MADAAKELAKVGYDIIDLNFACPAPKVIRRGRGGALLNEPDNAIEIFNRVRQVIDCPVMVKLRTGINSANESREKFWRIVESICSDGVDALTVHGRTVSKYFRGKTDTTILKELKQKFPDKTIIGSGDLMTAGDVIKMLNDTGIDGVTIARGAIGNPWIFTELWAHFNGDAEPVEPTLQQQRQVIQQHFEDVSHLYPPRKAVPYFRKFLVGYCKRHPDRKKAQAALLKAKNHDELSAVLNRWYEI